MYLSEVISISNDGVQYIDWSRSDVRGQSHGSNIGPDMKKIEKQVGALPDFDAPREA